METRTCGRSGLTLPVLGLGTWAFGGGSYWGAQDQGDVDDVVAQALEAGMNYFDTAEMYNAGASEQSLGRALKGRRGQAIVGSKVSPSNTAPAVLRRHCEASLQRLGTDYLDLYMVHWPINANALRHYTEDPDLLARPPSTPEAFLTLAALQKEGKIRHIGVSNFGERQLREVLELGVTIAVNELPYNLLMRAIETSLAPFCRDHGIGIIGYMALMQGVLAGSFASFDELSEMRTRTRHFSATRPNSRHGEAGIEPEVWRAVVTLRAVAREEGLRLADLAIAWTLANADITCVLAGCRNRAQLAGNAQAANLRLSPVTLRRLTAATDEVRRLLGDSADYFQGRDDSRVW